jgi:hypothetical protein
MMQVLRQENKLPVQTNTALKILDVGIGTGMPLHKIY